MPKSTEAWRKLKAAHRRGPKTVRLQRPRKKNGIPALANPKNIKKIQIIQDDASEQRYMVLIVFKQVFESMRLSAENTYTMPRNKLVGMASLFKKVLDEFGHNDYILGRLKEMKLNNRIGKCVIATGRVKKPDATFYITKPIIKKKDASTKPVIATKRTFEVL